jgi:hypothetical protein
LVNFSPFWYLAPIKSGNLCFDQSSVILIGRPPQTIRTARKAQKRSANKTETRFPTSVVWLLKHFYMFYTNEPA